MLKITRPAPSKSYMVIICRNSYEKLTKSEIMVKLESVRTLLKITLVYRKLYLAIIAPIHMKISPNMKLGQTIICSNLVLSTLICQYVALITII